MARWVILSLQPLLSQGPSLYWAQRRATLARSYLLTKCHVLCSNVRQATRYCFGKDACLLPQNVAIKCKLVFFWRFSMPYSNACANCRLFVLLMDFLHSVGDLSVSASCSPLCVHKLFVCNFVTDIRQRLVAPWVTFGCYASPHVVQYDVPTVFQARKVGAYHKIVHSLATSTLVWRTVTVPQFTISCIVSVTWNSYILLMTSQYLHVAVLSVFTNCLFVTSSRTYVSVL